MKKIEARKIHFGKYKGEYIVTLIAEHIGYIMWCLNNIKSFHLTYEEQIIYDAFAISIIKGKLNMTFPINDLKVHIKDKDSLDKLESPIFHEKDGKGYFVRSKAKEDVRDVVLKYLPLLKETEELLKEKEEYITPISDADALESINKQVEWCEDYLDEYLGIDEYLGEDLAMRLLMD